MRRVLLWLVAAVALTVVLVGVGVTVLGGSDDDEPASTSEQPFTTTPLAGLDVADLTVARGPFCEALDERQVDAALGSAPAQTRTWGNGDRVALGAGGEDVSHEFGCQFDAADGTVARAWAFAPPVDTATAAILAQRATKARGCTADPAAPPYGDPSLALTCQAADGTASASYRGLFGDTWVVCEVVRPAGATWDVADRAGRWCVGVVEGIDAARSGPET
jgi:hypothetical protein